MVTLSWPHRSYWLCWIRCVRTMLALPGIQLDLKDGLGRGLEEIARLISNLFNDHHDLFQGLSWDIASYKGSETGKGSLSKINIWSSKANEWKTKHWSSWNLKCQSCPVFSSLVKRKTKYAGLRLPPTLSSLHQLWGWNISFWFSSFVLCDELYRNPIRYD